MIVIGLVGALLSQQAQIETWTCFVEPRPGSGGSQYRTVFVVGEDRVVESSDLMTFGWEILESNGRRLTFASSNYGEDGYTGDEISQVASVITLDRRNETMKRFFIQDNGDRMESAEGRCVRDRV